MPTKKYPAAAVKTYGLDGEQQKHLGVLTGEAEKVAGKIDETVVEGREKVQGVIDDVMAKKLKVTEVAAKFSWSGHAKNFQNKLLDLMAGVKKSVNPAAPGGYVIEDYASAKVADHVAIQSTPSNLRGSRPDFMIGMAEDGKGPGGKGYIGLLDATSASPSSIGHILSKGGGSWVTQSTYPYVAETVYDPLDFGKGRKLTEEELQAAKLRAEAKLKAKELAAKAGKDALKKFFGTAVQLVVDVLNSGKPDEVARNLGLSGRRAASLLAALGLAYNPKTGAVTTRTDFDAWYSDEFLDPYFKSKVPISKKRKAVQYVIDHLG